MIYIYTYIILVFTIHPQQHLSKGWFLKCHWDYRSCPLNPKKQQMFVSTCVSIAPTAKPTFLAWFFFVEWRLGELPDSDDKGVQINTEDGNLYHLDPNIYIYIRIYMLLMSNGKQLCIVPMFFWSNGVVDVPPFLQQNSHTKKHYQAPADSPMSSVTVKLVFSWSNRHVTWKKRPACCHWKAFWHAEIKELNVTTSGDMDTSVEYDLRYSKQSQGKHAGGGRFDWTM